MATWQIVLFAVGVVGLIAVGAGSWIANRKPFNPTPVVDDTAFLVPSRTDLEIAWTTLADFLAEDGVTSEEGLTLTLADIRDRIAAVKMSWPKRVN